MAQHRTWDESRSPQWKYLLQKESAQKRKTRKDIEIERMRTQLEEGEVPPAKKRKDIKKKNSKKKLYVRIEGELKEQLQTPITSNKSIKDYERLIPNIVKDMESE